MAPYRSGHRFNVEQAEHGVDGWKPLELLGLMRVVRSGVLWLYTANRHTRLLKELEPQFYGAT